MTGICIIGTLNTEIILGPVPRAPQWGGQIFAPSVQWRHAGSALSVAIPLAKIGVPSTVIGTVGDDEAGRAILSRMQEAGLVLEGVEVVPDRPTGLCVSLHRSGGERAYISSLGAVSATGAGLLRRRTWSRLVEARWVLLTGLFCLEGLSIGEARELFSALREQGARTALDTGWDTQGWKKATVAGVRELLQVTDVFLPNWDEARKLGRGRSVAQVARSLSRMGPETVIIKLGARGAAGVFGDAFLRDKGFRRAAKDTTAAGEAFNAGVLYALANGFQPGDILRFANGLASLFLAEKGLGYPSRSDVERLAGPLGRTTGGHAAKHEGKGA